MPKGFTIALTALCALLFGGSSPALASDDPPKSCPRSKARPANPHGSVLMPVAPATEPSLLSDEILPVKEPVKERRRDRRRSTSSERSN